MLAHGVVGQRFFPATLSIDDPFVADELSLPTVSITKRHGSADEPPTLETDFSAELSKRLSPDLGLSLGGTLILLDPDQGPTIAGFDNMAIGLKYVFLKSAEHELILSGGVDIDVGGTGQGRVGGVSFSTFTPSLFFGEGLGDLPAPLRFLGRSPSPARSGSRCRRRSTRASFSGASRSSTACSTCRRTCRTWDFRRRSTA